MVRAAAYVCVGAIQEFWTKDGVIGEVSFWQRRGPTARQNASGGHFKKRNATYAQAN